METAETIAPLVARPRNNRSAVSNGNRLFAPDVTDGRTCAARRFRDILEQILADLGGADRLSEGTTPALQARRYHEHAMRDDGS